MLLLSNLLMWHPKIVLWYKYELSGLLDRRVIYFCYVRLRVEIYCFLDCSCVRVSVSQAFLSCFLTRKHLHTKVTPDFHLTYSKNRGNLGSD